MLVNNTHSFVYSTVFMDELLKRMLDNVPVSLFMFAVTLLTLKNMHAQNHASKQKEVNFLPCKQKKVTVTSKRCLNHNDAALTEDELVLVLL